MNVRYKRADRVADVIHREISYLLLKKVKDPRVRNVTVTGVKMTDDLRLAKVYYTSLDQDKSVVEEGLSSAGKMIRREIGQVLNLRFVPEIRFDYDVSFDYADRIERVIKEIKDES
ncbi:MAG: 30S ribosome-binding factor RbfA [Deltaproteobacteria bacterium]|nr:30S ribosome-binding factor RbfA [Deltaproteobacteria bacterium]